MNYTVSWHEPCGYVRYEQSFDLFEEAAEYYLSVKLRTSRVELLDKTGNRLYVQ